MKVLYYIYIYHSYSIFGLTLGHEFCDRRGTRARKRRECGREEGVRCVTIIPLGVLRYHGEPRTVFSNRSMRFRLTRQMRLLYCIVLYRGVLWISIRGGGREGGVYISRSVLVQPIDWPGLLIWTIVMLLVSRDFVGNRSRWIERFVKYRLSLKGSWEIILSGGMYL